VSRDGEKHRNAHYSVFKERGKTGAGCQASEIPKLNYLGVIPVNTGRFQAPFPASGIDSGEIILHNQKYSNKKLSGSQFQEKRC
jgi:hypothetical protein